MQMLSLTTTSQKPCRHDCRDMTELVILCTKNTAACSAKSSCPKLYIMADHSVTAAASRSIRHFGQNDVEYGDDGEAVRRWQLLLSQLSMGLQMLYAALCSSEMCLDRLGVLAGTSN